MPDIKPETPDASAFIEANERARKALLDALVNPVPTPLHELNEQDAAYQPEGAVDA